MLVTFILSQRKSIPAIQSSVETLAARYGRDLAADGSHLFGFPTAARLARTSEEELRACRLGYRAPYVLDAARQVAEGTLDLAALRGCPNTQLLQALQRVKGVGEKVAACIGLFAYGHLALAPIDTWIRKIIDQVYGGADPFPAYGETAGILQQFAFYYALKHKADF